MVWTKKQKCAHGRELWWHHEDRQPRHMSKSGNTPQSDICSDSHPKER
jgi:hypothetical protein